MKTEVIVSSEYGMCELRPDGVQFTAALDAKEAWFRMNVEFTDWEKDTFIFLPACAYNGNKFRRVNRPYPPQYREEEYSVDNEPLIGKVPALNPDGSGQIEVAAGDMSVPCVGIFYREKKEALFILTGQQVKDRDIGYTVQEGKVELSFPARRSEHYATRIPDPDMGIAVSGGEELFAPVRMYRTSCEDFTDFYREFFRLRKALVPVSRLENGYTEELWDIMEESINRRWWSGRWYGPKNLWRCVGWDKGTETAAFARKGNSQSYHRAIKTVDYITLPEHQAPSGFFYEFCTSDGEPCDTVGKIIKPEERAPHLLRKSADSLLTLMKVFEVVSPKPDWEIAVRRLADAFVTLFDRYGKFGRTVDSKTGEILLGYGEGAVSAISGLVKAAAYFDRQEYLDTARRAAEYYYNEFMKKGMSCAGPSDILCAPDSESAYPLVEGCVNLYEATGEKKWLSRAETYVHYFSSWVMPYAYRFPKRSEFNRLQIDTTGSVFASVQNKHSAPGICVASGESIYRLYRYTGKKEYLELLQEIAYFIPQCVSTRKRPIRTYMVGEQHHRFGVDLPEGFINERVNTSDWEGEESVGQIFFGACWPEFSLLLSFAELMDYPEFGRRL